MRIGLKRTFFPLHMFFPIIALAIIAALLYSSFFKGTNEAAAQVALLHSSTCLGGWKNPDRASGAPQVVGDAQATYDETNSATLTDTMTQLFCAGFTGDIPEEADRTKISVRFSWQMESHEAFLQYNLDKEEPEYSTEILTITESGSTTPEITGPASSEGTVPEDGPAAPESPEEPEPVIEEQEEAPAPEPEPEAAPETVSWWQWLVPFAYAQEESVEQVQSTVDEAPVELPVTVETPTEPDVEVPTVEEVVRNASSTETTASNDSASADEIASSTATSSVSYSYVSPVFDQNKNKENALFEVLFTVDNEQWHSLGYVSRINNDITFELPTHIFQTVEDFNKLQISLESVERIDDTPTIYLDSMWVEVSYVGAGEDPLSPPGSVPGDMITNTYTVDDRELVTVFRNVSLDTISNILMITASTSTSTTSSTTASTTLSAPEVVIASSTPDTSTATSTATSSVVIFDAPISLETKQILRETPGVVVELWLHNTTDDTWMRVADNTITATLPRAVLIETKVFWFGPYNSSVWVFDSLAQGYSSQSITPQERVSVDFVDSVGASQTVWFNPKTEMLELLMGDE